jgi:hypothetical protein
MHAPCQAHIGFVTHCPIDNNITEGQIQYLRDTPEQSPAGSAFPEIEMELVGNDGVRWAGFFLGAPKLKALSRPVPFKRHLSSVK